MLTHKIEPKKTLVQYTPPSVYQNNGRGSAYGTMKNPWDKLTYSKWIEKIKTHYRTGDFVCLSTSPITTDKIPFYYEIVDIAEVHYLVDFDVEHREPMCLHVVTQSGYRMAKCPSSIRPLTDEEAELVCLQDTPLFQTGC